MEQERIKVRRGGKVVRVIENELAKYISKGYVIVEDKKVTEKPNKVSQEPIIKTFDTPKPRTSKRKRD